MLSHRVSGCFLSVLVVTQGQSVFLGAITDFLRAVSLKLLHKVGRMKEGEQKGLQLS